MIEVYYYQCGEIWGLFSRDQQLDKKVFLENAKKELDALGCFFEDPPLIEDRYVVEQVKKGETYYRLVDKDTEGSFPVTFISGEEISYEM